MGITNITKKGDKVNKKQHEKKKLVHARKFDAGEGSQYMSRKAALKKLQLSLNDFRRLCILKGIYPREPRNRKRAQKGRAGISILYHIKDIQFLMHEKIIWTMRDLKVFNKRVSKAKGMQEISKMKRLLANHPTFTLDHIVKERYPTFIDALRDLDDCLTLCFLFSTFPSMEHIPRDQSILCRRLTIEFLHAVIAAKALRKVFVSIKGYYYQAELKGQKITWIVPHHFSFEPQKRSEVDFKLMSNFTEFYIYMLGFVNFRLYHTLNLYYPPKFNTIESSEKDLVDEETFVSERISALNVPLVSLNPTARTEEEEEMEIDNFSNETDSTKMEEAKSEAEKDKKLKTLFKGLKFFINREVPREPLVFVIQCFGGEVSWDKTLFVGSTFNEDDESITHQIVDRSKMDKQYLSRYYVQPQWIFDSVNARDLLSVDKYLMGCVLPPHLSPFSDNRRSQAYIPPEERILMDPDYKMANLDGGDEESDEKESDQDVQEDEEKEDEEDDEIAEEEHEVPATDEKERQRMEMKKKMAVKKGELTKGDPWEEARKERQEYRLREKMIKKKHRKLYKSMMEGREDRAKQIWLLRKKRRLHDTAEKEKRKEIRKAQKASNQA